MSQYYYAAFVPAEGSYAIFMPDFPEIASQGEDMAECMEMSADALKVTLEEYARTRKTYPAPSSLSTTKQKLKEELTSLDVPMPEEIFFQLIEAPNVDMTPVKISISLARSVLENIDNKANKFGMTRSGFLAKAAEAYSG